MSKRWEERHGRKDMYDLKDVALYICTTYYHVYITLLKQLNQPILMDIVVCDDIPTGQTLAQRLLETGLFRHVWFVQESLLPEERGKNKLDWVFFQHRRRFRVIRPLLPFDVHDYNDVYIFHDATPLGMYLADARKPYHLVEDSLNFYQRLNETAQAVHRKPHTLKYWLRRLLNSGYFPLGESRYVKDIEVNENQNLQVKGKPVIEHSRATLQNKLSQISREKVLEVFGYPELPEIGERCALLLTEPFFADGLCASLEEQVSIYQKMVVELEQKGFQTILKPHPRDAADYSKLGVDLWDRFFPIELLAYLPAVPDFACAVAVSSSAIYSVSAQRRLLWPQYRQK